MAELEYKIVEHLGVIEERNNLSTEINRVAWGKFPPKLDIRKWDKSKEKPVPLKGISISDDAAILLTEILVKNGFLEDNEIEDILKEKSGGK